MVAGFFKGSYLQDVIFTERLSDAMIAEYLMGPHLFWWQTNWAQFLTLPIPLAKLSMLNIILVQ